MICHIVLHFGHLTIVLHSLQRTVLLKPLLPIKSIILLFLSNSDFILSLRTFDNPSSGLSIEVSTIVTMAFLIYESD
jgi:hypothetical protein